VRGLQRLHLLGLGTYLVFLFFPGGFGPSLLGVPPALAQLSRVGRGGFSRSRKSRSDRRALAFTPSAAWRPLSSSLTFLRIVHGVLLWGSGPGGARRAPARILSRAQGGREDGAASPHPSHLRCACPADLALALEEGIQRPSSRGRAPGIFGAAHRCPREIDAPRLPRLVVVGLRGRRPVPRLFGGKPARLGPSPPPSCPMDPKSIMMSSS